MSEKKFELRKLCAKDIFVMVKIISKISISEFKNCFNTILRSSSMLYGAIKPPLC